MHDSAPSRPPNPSGPRAQSPDVAVLLSTRNGASHLEEQLRSLAAQERVSVRLVARDDGSTDVSPDLLENWASRMPSVVLTASPAGASLGIVGSYMTLLSDASADASYIAFADQDDVWQSGKLARAVERLALEDPALPALYCARLEIAGEDLQPLGHTPRLRRPPAFANALVENIATGCTVVMNRSARDLIVSHPWHGALYHDWWCYLAVSAFGRVIWDSEPTMLYRQHAGNAIGSGIGPATRLMRKIARQVRGGTPGRLAGQWRAFLNAYEDDLPAYHAALLHRTIRSQQSFESRLALARAPEPWRQSWLDDLAYRALLLLGRL